MKIGIRMKIFLPVLILLILFPIAARGIFAATSKNYMVSAAGREVNALLEETKKVMKSIYADADAASVTDRQELSRQLLKAIREELKGWDGTAAMMVFNSKKKLVYPKEAVAPDLYDYCLDVLENEKSRELLSASQVVSIGQNNYIAEILEVSGEGNMRARYLVAYAPVQDNKSMLDAAGRLVFLITASLAVISILAGWLIAGNIGKQLDRLCLHMALIGKKDFCMLKQDFSIRELDKLKDSINDMTGRLSKSDEAQADFFQNASHELRTPLMSISGYAQGIEQGIFADQKNAAAVIASESQRLKELVDGILTISKLDNENVVLQLCTICLGDFVSESLEQLGGVHMLSGITTAFHSQEEDVMVSADAVLLSKSFQNVMSNCIRYASAHINIEIFRDDGHVCLTIEDDGPGFSQEELACLFTRFYKGKKGKFGIGLSIAKASMEYMGGSITAENGSLGAKFTLTLKAAE